MLFLEIIHEKIFEELQTWRRSDENAGINPKLNAEMRYIIYLAKKLSMNFEK